MRRLIEAAAGLYHRLSIIQHPLIRHVIALGWTLFSTVLLVQSSSRPVVGPPAPPGAPDLWREVQLTTGHIVVFSLLVCLWWWAAQSYLPSHRALFVAVVFAAIYGFLTEAAQVFTTTRNPSLYDVVVNWIVIAITAVWLAPDRAHATDRLPVP